MSATNPYPDLPNIFFGKDGNTFALIVENQPPVEIKWDEEGSDRILYNASLIKTIRRRGRTRRPRFRPI